MSPPHASGGLRRVGVVAKLASPEAVAAAGNLVDWLVRRGLDVAPDETTARAIGRLDGPLFQPDEPYDLVVALGGDGTLLSVARNLRCGVPILGVNLGSLGFLTEVGRTELYPSLVRVLRGRFGIEERSLLDVELARAGSGEAPARHRVLNDAVISKSALARIIELSLRVDGRLVASFRADGLIISTPTGSTAYNLSAGGPLVNPLLPVVLLTPICPHHFGLRPLVVPDQSRIEVTLETRGEEVYVTLDGQYGEELGSGDTIRVERSQRRVHLVKTSDRTFYDSLRGKLRWGA
jgi:NAD+ kinase